MNRTSSGWIWLPLTLLMIGIDQGSKLWIVHHFAEYERLHVLPVLDITLWYNKGAAFSFLDDQNGWQRWLFTGLAFVVGIGLVVLRAVTDPGRSHWKCDRPPANRSRGRFHSVSLE